MMQLQEKLSAICSGIQSQQSPSRYTVCLSFWTVHVTHVTQRWVILTRLKSCMRVAKGEGWKRGGGEVKLVLVITEKNYFPAPVKDCTAHDQFSLCNFFLCVYIIPLDRDLQVEHMIYSFRKDSLVNPAHYLLSSFTSSFASELFVEAAVGRNAGQVMHWGNSRKHLLFLPFPASASAQECSQSHVLPSWTCSPLGWWPWKAVHWARSFLNLLFSSLFSFFFLTLFSVSVLCFFSHAASLGLLVWGVGASWACSLWSVFREETCKRLKCENFFLFP